MKALKKGLKKNELFENNNKRTNKNNILSKLPEKNDKKIVIFVCFIIVTIIGIMLITLNREKADSDYKKNEYNVKIHIDFTENLILSRYNIIFSIGKERETLTHGEDMDLSFSLEEGNYTLTFTNSEDSSIKNETTIDVKSNIEIGYKISCHYDEISVENLYIDLEEELEEDEVKIKNDKSAYLYKNYKDVIRKLEKLGFTNIVEKPMYDIVIGWTEEGEVDNVTINGSDTYKRGNIFKKDAEIIVSYHLKEENDPTKKVENTESKNKTENESETNELKYNYFTTNDDETAKKGNSGKFAFVKKGGNYDVYWIIDFDNGYVYDFSDGNGDGICEKIRIKTGNLNDGLELSYKNSSNAWAKYIHFKYKNQPHQLIIVDNDYLQYELSTTSLKNALEMMKNKTIRES